MASLDQHDRDLLERYKQSLAPPDAAVQASWAAIRERVEDEPVTAARGRAVWIGVAVAAALVLGSLVGFQVSEQLRDDDGRHDVQSLDEAVRSRGAEAPVVEPGRRVGVERASGSVVAPAAGDRAEPVTTEAPGPVPVEAAVPTPTPAAGESSASSDAAAGSASAAGTKPPRPHRVAPKPPRPAPASSTTSSIPNIRAELELLGKARAALEADDFDRVLALVQRHDREFPQGTMREEIAMLRVGALCEVGPKARWVAARARFDREFPGSPLAVHLRQDCSP